MIEDIENKMEAIAANRVGILMDENNLYCVHNFRDGKFEVIYINGIDMRFEDFANAVEFAVRYIDFGNEIEDNLYEEKK
mgnify:CR=1 FL=1